MTIESVDTTHARSPSSARCSTLRGAKVLDTEIDAGAAGAHPPRAPAVPGQAARRAVIEVTVPAEMAGRDVEIELAPGYEVERPLPTPNNVAELMADAPGQSPSTRRASSPPSGLRERRRVRAGRSPRGLPPGAIDTLRPSSRRPTRPRSSPRRCRRRSRSSASWSGRTRCASWSAPSSAEPAARPIPHPP